MSRYLLRDIQAVLRGVRRVAESSLKLETEKVSQRLGDFRSQPFFRNAPTSLTTGSQAFSVKEMAARAGVVLRGVQEQFRNVTGLNAAPVVAFDNGSILYSERIQSHNSQKHSPATVPTGSVSNAPQPEGKANEAAERAKQFMNPPVAPMDPADKNEFVAMPEMGGANGENKSQAADFMKNETGTGVDSQFAPDSSKSTKSAPTKEIVAEDGSMNIEDIKKATQIRYYSSQAGKRPDKESKKVPDALEHQTLGAKSRERRVPASRTARLATFGGLAAGLGLGAVAEVTRRTLGMGPKDGPATVLDKSAFLTEANAERIVETLCRVRGAALKLGQMISIQDTSLLSPQIREIFERVRQSADFMPKSQMEKTMQKELGPNWRTLLPEFDDKPFAAASIGQVHLGKTKDGREVAVKIQYPGVADSIDSDIRNLMGILNMWNIFPKGMYMDNLMRVARSELAWECDYVREANYMRRFREIYTNDPVFVVPSVVDELSSKRVITTEYVYGETLDKALTLDQPTRDYVATNFLRLCFEELFTHRLMQTDPNWANFLYNNSSKKIYLLDFGASRTFEKKFTDSYIDIIKGAATGDRDLVLKNSQKLGFLTGMETKALANAHVDGAMILGEPFKTNEPFDFGSQDITTRIHKLIPLLAEQRLTPPPEESYSLHRKLAGAFLLCSNMKARIRCKDFFDEIYNKYQSETTTR